MVRYLYTKGAVYTTPSGDCVIQKYISSEQIKIRFLETGYITIVTGRNLRKGEVKDKLKPNIFGVGFIGDGQFNRANQTRLYDLWRAMLRRCYSPVGNKDAEYSNCSVCKRWHNFQNFCEDVMKMPNWNTSGFHLDKDLRVKGNRIYSPKYCSFVPQEINLIFGTKTPSKYPTGVLAQNGKYYAQIGINGDRYRSKSFNTSKEASSVYKQLKRKYVCQMARKYKSALHSDVYKTLRSYVF